MYILSVAISHVYVKSLLLKVIVISNWERSVTFPKMINVMSSLIGLLQLLVPLMCQSDLFSTFELKNVYVDITCSFHSAHYSLECLH